MFVFLNLHIEYKKPIFISTVLGMDEWMDKKTYWEEKHQGSAAAHNPQIKTCLYAKKNSEKMDCLFRNSFRHPAEF